MVADVPLIEALKNGLQIISVWLTTHQYGKDEMNTKNITARAGLCR